MKPKYQVGDRVKIKDRLIGARSHHPVRRYEGTVMTVRKVRTFSDGYLFCYCMEEDKEECHGRGWAWFDEYIAGLAEEFEDPIDDSAFPEITFEQLLASTTLPERKTS